MKITNRRERKVAMLRFTGLYLLGLAIPIFIIVSSLTVRTVDRKDSAEILGQLRKKDEAFKEVYVLATKLNQMQRLKQNENYDEMRVQFEKAVDALQKKYLNDTATYATAYELAGLLRNFHKDFDKDGEAYKNTVATYEEQLKNVRDSASEQIEALRSDGSGSKTGLATANMEIKSLESENKDIRRQLATAERTQNQCAKDLDKLTEKCRNCTEAIDNISTSLKEIESKAKDISKPIFSGNKDIKKSILAEVDKIRSNASKVRRDIAP